ncbi:MAG TPA: VWA domain-containing protein [Candidatus Acidoferrum sp.]|nr:VWA domain-containing protein [Candidatus Acidoferrum sp.]
MKTARRKSNLLESLGPRALTLLAAVAFVGAPVFARAQQEAAPTAIPAPASPRPAQKKSQAPPPALRAQSNLVRIDVEVTDKSGKPIKGLRADQFTIYDDGKAQPISVFSYSDIESLETATAGNSSPIMIPVDNGGPNSPSAEAVSDAVRDRRLIVLFFDFSSMQTDDLIRAHDAAEKFIKQQMTPADLVAMVGFSSDLSVIVNFTNDRAALEKGVARIRPGVSSELGTPLYAAAENGEYDVQQYTGDAYTADETEFNVFNTDQKLAAVEGIVNVLSGIPGRKLLVEFTGGITQTGEENRTALRAATDAANRADVSIYSIDARGLFSTPPGGDATANAATGTSMFTGASVFHQTDQREDSRDTLSTLSSDTGGQAFFDLGDLSDAFPEIQKENTGYYLIGYSLPNGIKLDGTWHSVRVKVNVPGARVRFRNGYYAPRDFQHLEKESKEEQLADAMNSENPILDLPVAVEVAQFRLSDQQTYVPISAKISSSALDWAKKHNLHEASFDFAAEVRADPSGQDVADLRDTINVHLDEQKYQQVNQSSLLYQGGVVLSPGRYRLKFLARENESGKIGTFEQEIVIPPAQQGKLELSSVMLSSQLVPVEKSSEVQTKTQGLRAKMTSSPLELNGERIVPSVTRFFTQQQTLYVFFQAYWPAKAEGLDPNSLRAGLIFFRGGVQVNATPLLAPNQTDEKTRAVSFRISLPLEKLPAGRYTVQAVVIAPGTQRAAFARSYLALQASAAPAALPAGTNAPKESTPQKPGAGPPSS